MLEVLAAIGLAGNIVQFAEFVSKIVCKTYDIHNQAGALTSYSDLAVVSTDLSLLNAAIIAGAQHASPQLRKICNLCYSVTNDLDEALLELKLGDKKNFWRSFRTALKSVLNKDKLRELENRLDGIRAQLQLHLTVELR
jgi:hypothetical protein